MADKRQNKSPVVVCACHSYTDGPVWISVCVNAETITFFKGSSPTHVCLVWLVVWNEASVHDWIKRNTERKTCLMLIYNSQTSEVRWGGRCRLSQCPGARCSSVIRAFARGAMGRRIDHSWWTHWAISRSSQWSTIRATKAVVYAILSVGWCM